MQIAISAFHQQRRGTHFLTPIVPGAFTWTVQSGDLAKARERLIERVRKELPKLGRGLFTRLHVPSGRRLTHAHVELVLREDGEKRRVSGNFPVVLEERPAGGEHLLRIAYHPLSPADWFELEEHSELAVDVARHYSRSFSPSQDLDALKLGRNDALLTVRFQVDPPSLRGLLKSQRPSDELTALGHAGNLSALLRVAVNQTARAAAGQLKLGLPRERERQRLAQLLCVPKKSSVLLVGPPGSGKSALLAQAVSDLLEAEDFHTHGNLDLVHNVLRLSGRQIIAGMSYVGQWEARAVELLAFAKRHRRILWLDDAHAFSSIGKTTVSDRVLADFFRGPLARGDLIALAECTPEQFSLLQHEAPGFAAAFTVLQLEPTTTEQGLAMALFESRRQEETFQIAFEPRSLAAIVEQSGSLSSGAALPGRALSALKALAKSRASQADPDADEARIGVDQVLQFFGARTGLPEVLLSPNERLPREQLKRELEQQIMGQDAALEAACDLITSLRAKLTGPGRPYGVFLFTGPTGTGKTELAKCLAEYLYGASERLLRFDMGELNTPDAAARLIGDAFEPDGQLTSAVRAQPFCVLLFDEVEKAHPSVLNLMLQIFEDARLTDARGTVTDFRHTVIVLTSNLGTGRQTVRGFNADASGLASDIARAVREFFPPELFNRIDRVVPFAPLSEQAARQIVRKELANLIARPGLSERNTFVRFTDAVVERVVRDGYSPEYGARALKRHIDREIGGALARAIASDKPAEMRLLWMHASESGAGVGLQNEALREAEPFAEPSSLQALLDSDYTRLRARIPTALRELRGFESDGRLAALGEQLSEQLSRYRLGERGRADEVFNLDSLKAHAEQLSLRIEARSITDPGLQAAERQRKVREGEQLSGQDFSTVGAHFGTRFGDERRAVEEAPNAGTSSERTRALLRDLAEVALLEGLLESAHEPDRHVALVEIVQLSLHHERRRFAKGSPGLCAWLAKAYAEARGAFDVAATASWDGAVRRVTPAQLDEALLERPKLVMLRLFGPGVADFLQRETGCQVRRTLASGPEIVRVRVLPGHHDPVALAERHLESIRAFEDGLEARGPVQSNPEALLPVIRGLRFEPEATGLAPLRVEDYRLTCVTTRRVRQISELLAELWLLGAGLPRLISHEVES
ncbi:MAG TPA: AAA family ATPase [Polyangiaceae bacterium]|nr:AAA family ATPase [Polyangiaceae bacterium]